MDVQLNVSNDLVSVNCLVNTCKRLGSLTCHVASRCSAMQCREQIKSRSNNTLTNSVTRYSRCLVGSYQVQLWQDIQFRLRVICILR